MPFLKFQKAMGRILVGLFLMSFMWDAAAADAPKKSFPQAETVPMPSGSGGIGFDDLGFSSHLGKVLAPGGGTGKLFLIDPDSHQIAAVGGFSAEEKYDGGHGEGVTSVDEGMGVLFAIDRTAMVVDVVDPSAKAIITSAPLQSSPDYVRYVGLTHEVWVTQPNSDQIEVFSLFAAGKLSLMHSASISVPGGPESLIMDPTRQRAYTHLWSGKTVSVDLRTHTVVAKWKNSCRGSRGIALDEKRGFLFVGCAEGKAAVLDVARDGRILGTLEAGSGVDVISYNPMLSHLYLPGAGSATLAVIGISKEGRPSLLGTLKTVRGAHCATSDNRGNVWVCDPDHGQLLLLKDTFPPSGV